MPDKPIYITLEMVENNKKDTLDADVEEDELIKDWSEMSRIPNSNTILSIPKRGEKDYGPDGTDIQELLLYRASKAMFDTLEHSLRGSVIKSQVKAYYIPEKHIAFVPHAKGSFIKTMGESDTNGALWLQFYEFLYLSERGTVTPYWQLERNNQMEDIPLSIEDLYSFFKNQTEIDNFSIYAHLKRLGFIVQMIDDSIITNDNLSFYPPGLNKFHLSNSVSSIFNKITSYVTFCDSSLFNGLIYSKWHFYFKRYSTTPQLYNSLNRLISFYKAPSTVSELYQERKNMNLHPHTEDALTITFNVWKPNPNFKKKNPELPDYQVVTYNKNIRDQSFPTYKEIRNLFKSLEYKFEFIENSRDTDFWDKNSYINGVSREIRIKNLKDKQKKKDKKVEDTPKKTTKSNKSLPPHVQQTRRLKNGYRNFLLAIMDNGIISFAKIAEADFGSENVWYVSQTNPTNRANQSKRKSNLNVKRTTKS